MRLRIGIDGKLIRVYISGRHVTIVAHSRSVHTSLEAAQELEKEDIECEVGFDIVFFTDISLQFHHITTLVEGDKMRFCLLLSCIPSLFVWMVYHGWFHVCSVHWGAGVNEGNYLALSASYI